MEKIKLGVGTWTASRYSYSVEFLDWAKRVGFSGVELGHDTFLDFLHLKDSELEEVKEEFAKRELEVCAVACITWEMTNEKTVAKAIKKIERAIDVAEFFDCKIVNFIAGGPVSQKAREQHYQICANAVETVSKKADKKDIMLSLELHLGSICDTAESTLRLLDMVNLSNLYINPDLGNHLTAYPESKEDWREALRQMAPRSIYWHVKNFQRVHFKIGEKAYANFIAVPLPYGVIDHRQALKIMKEAGFEGYIAIEHCAPSDHLASIERGKRYLADLLANPTHSIVR